MVAIFGLLARVEGSEPSTKTWTKGRPRTNVSDDSIKLFLLHPFKFVFLGLHWKMHSRAKWSIKTFSIRRLQYISLIHSLESRQCPFTAPLTCPDVQSSPKRVKFTCPNSSSNSASVFVEFRSFIYYSML